MQSTYLNTFFYHRLMIIEYEKNIYFRKTTMRSPNEVPVNHMSRYCICL